MARSAKQTASAGKRRALLVALCEELPEVSLAPLGDRHTVFTVRKKTFAYHLHDHHGDGRIALCCKSTAREQQALVAADPAIFFLPPYLGAKGWVGMRIDGTDVDWERVRDLVRAAFRLAAPKKLVALLD